MEEKRKLIIQAIVCALLLAIIWGGYLYEMKRIDRRIEYVLADDFTWVVQVDEVRTEENEFVMEGFAFKINQDAKEKEFDIVLHNLVTDEYIFPKMEYIDRKDVNDYFLCEYDYTKSGFVARIKENKLNLKDDYEILLLPAWTHKPYQISTFLFDGEIMFTNPKKYVQLDVAGTRFEEIVEGGILRVCRPDVGMYVYQYDGNLYWIADESCEFVNKESTYIDCMVSTTQPNFLPENRKDFYYESDNLDFYFQNNELIDVYTNGYRVAKLGIPREYSVSCIKTGHSANGEWIWKDNFRIYYQFVEGDMKNE